jgi:uncharacterized glyoxalase superfamily protein PhnB
MKKFKIAQMVLISLCIVFIYSNGLNNRKDIQQEKHGELTGEILPVFYVKDVIKSVKFYSDKLGFKFNHYWDYENNKPSKEWKSNQKPVSAQVAAGSQKFLLHLFRTPEELNNAGTIHYFEVKDVDAHYNWILARGAKPEPLYERPWMRMFLVNDPDGHKIFFYTRPE